MKTIRSLVTLCFGIALCCLLSVTAFASDYTVVPGDCLWRIARRELGSGVRWTEIYEINKQQIKDPHWIYPRQVFAIPVDGEVEPAELIVAEPVEEIPVVDTGSQPLVGTAVDYAGESNWIAQPEAEKVADTLYFVGNCYFLSGLSDAAVCDIDSRSMRVAARADLATNRVEYAGTNVFAPYYRQVGVYNGEAVDKEELLGEPRTDVYAALNYYFTHLNGGRSVLIVGHGQGAELLRILLEDYWREHPEHAARVTAVVLE